MRLKPRILILTDWFVPGYRAGGPIQSVYNLVVRLSKQVDFLVITGDSDLNDSEQYEVEAFNVILAQPWGEIIYTTPQKRSIIIRKYINDSAFSKVYLNSLFSVEFTLRPLLYLILKRSTNRVTLAPRGMLGKGALKLKSRKKKAFISLFKSFGLPHKLAFHSTDVSETRDISRVFGNRIRVYEVGNIPANLKYEPKSTKSEVLNIVFASRISPKKNLLAAAQYISEAKVKCTLSVYGEMEDESYLSKCQASFDNTGEMKVKGAVAPHELYEEIRNCDFFILPTLNENFGHSIIESLSLGVPVMISDQTPWNDIETFGAGWVTPLTDGKRWKDVLIEANNMSNEEYCSMSKKAIEYVQTKIDFDVLCDEYLSMFDGK